jgi:hypothetical protein
MLESDVSYSERIGSSTEEITKLDKSKLEDIPFRAF